MPWQNGYNMRMLCVWKKTAVIILSVTVIVVLLKCCLNNEKDQRHFELSEELEFSFSNADDIIETIHDGLGRHARSFTITYSADDDYLEETKKLVDELMNYAMYNTDSPTEGDYIRYQYGGYKLSYQKLDGRKNCDYQLTITPIYYSTVQEERDVDEKVEEILEDLEIGKKTSEREKVKAVYDYICHNVNYDYVHENNSHYHKDSTAYAALVERYASCQGYAVAVFRLLKELGIECSVVTGTGINNLGENEFHAWNEVFVDDEIYNVDATWDAGRENYQYFLIKDGEFVNHVKD
jgi:transglutaminase-like putative cysteine protease